MGDLPRIRYGILTMTSALEIGEKFIGRRAWESRGDTDSMWDKTTPLH